MEQVSDEQSASIDSGSVRRSKKGDLMSVQQARRESAMAVTALLVLCSLALASAQSWPQWRGPLRTGAATTFKVPAPWPDRLTRVWKVQAGEGHSSPLAVAGRAYLLSRIGEQEAVTAFELSSGKVVWRQSYDAPYQMNPAATTHGKGPKSTPALDSGRLFSFGISGILSAWQASDGRLLWRKNFKTDFKSQTPDFGVATSPLGRREPCHRNTPVAPEAAR